MRKIEIHRAKPEYPTRQSKNLSQYAGWGSRQLEDGDSDRFVSYWYPMSGQNVGYDDDPDYREYYSW